MVQFNSQVMKFVVSLIMLISLRVHAQYAQPCDEIPLLNQEILKVLKPYKGKKISRGECWDAAQLALDKVGAEWDGEYVFGRVIDPATECIQPGDIVQFEDVYVEVTTENGGYTETFEHHTAIVYKVSGPGIMELFHQNTGEYGRKMGITPFDLANVTKGTITFFRPVKAG